MKPKDSENSNSKKKVSAANATDGSKIYDLLKNYVDFDEFEKEPSAKNNKDSNDLSNLFDLYCDFFSPISEKIEKWAPHRRSLLKAVDSANVSVTKIKLLSAKGKMALSAIDVIGTSAALVLDRFGKSWAPTVLYTSAGFGCLSFICSMIDITKTSSTMEDILKELRKDYDCLKDIQDSLQEMYQFDRDVQELFPHGIDPRVVKLIQEPYTARKTSAKNYECVIKALAETNDRVQIFLAVLITNLKANPELQENKEFIENAKDFAKSRIAKIWWKRMKHQGMLPISLKTKLFTQLNSLSTLESIPIRTVPLLSSPIWRLNSFPTFGSIFMNSLVVFDAYCDWTQDGKTREAELLQEMKQSLEVEYEKIMDVYHQLTPFAVEWSLMNE